MKKLLLMLFLIGASINAAIRWDARKKRYYTTMQNLPASFNHDEYHQAGLYLDYTMAIICDKPRNHVLATILEMMIHIRKFNGLEYQVIAKDLEEFMIMINESNQNNILTLWKKMINGKI